MAIPSNRLINKSTTWSSDLRPRVGATVKHQGFYWSNLSGVNSEPGLSIDWLNLGPITNSPLSSGDHVSNYLVTDASDNPVMIISGTYDAGDPKKLASFSNNTVTRYL